jgi:hypothetical protein
MDGEFLVGNPRLKTADCVFSMLCWVPTAVGYFFPSRFCRQGLVRGEFFADGIPFATLGNRPAGMLRRFSTLEFVFRIAFRAFWSQIIAQVGG